jgi:hypothetical protein
VIGVSIGYALSWYLTPYMTWGDRQIAAIGMGLVFAAVMMLLIYNAL